MTPCLLAAPTSNYLAVASSQVERRCIRQSLGEYYETEGRVCYALLKHYAVTPKHRNLHPFGQLGFESLMRPPIHSNVSNCGLEVNSSGFVLRALPLLGGVNPQDVKELKIWKVYSLRLGGSLPLPITSEIF